MSSDSPKLRIKDIAELAGVSEGTVDRVLHNRGDVSQKSRDAVKKVLDEINYSPNLLARSLASKKLYKFLYIIPQHQTNDYWEMVEKGFAKAATEFSHYNVKIEKMYFNQFDVNSFIEVAEKAIDALPDAVFLAPIFKNESLSFSNQLVQLTIPLSFIDSMIPEAEFSTYYGQNSFQSGYIAAKMLLSALPLQAQVLIIRTQRKGSVSNQTISRYKGFMQYITDHNLDNQYDIINIEFNNDDEKANRTIFEQCIAVNQNIQAAITFNSKVHRLAKLLVELEQGNLRIIGYDLLKQNLAYLKSGVINVLIAQRPDKQSYATVSDMCKQLIYKQEVKKINYMPIDILMKENIDDYINFVE